jgi:diguanylate cyclase (GGDEF)-like protein
MGVADRYQQLFDATSVASVLFQLAGTILIASLSFVVGRALRYRLMSYWTYGWMCYAAALVPVPFAFHSGLLSTASTFAYFFFEYCAGLLIFAACLYSATDRPPPPRFWLAFAPAFVVAFALAASGAPIFWRYAAHTAIVGLLWAACLFALWPALRRSDSGPGVRILAVGLVLLSLDYLHHLPTAFYLAANHLSQSAYYYTVVSVIDALLEFVLGFGTVVVIVDKVRADLARANRRLEYARERTEEALHTDALTGALSRYSFAATFGESEGRDSVRGCIVMIDLDGLKQVNDAHGHAAGDDAIRAVASGLRTMVRHGDRVYRWGGDEFVVVMPEMGLDLAKRRMAALDDAVNRSDANDLTSKVGRLSVSWGAAAFDGSTTIDSAIAAADAAMYRSKGERKQESDRVT